MVHEIRVIGIDHGIRHTGYGILSKVSDLPAPFGGQAGPPAPLPAPHSVGQAGDKPGGLAGEGRAGKITCIDQGSIDTSPDDPFPKRLQKIYSDLNAIIRKWQPDIMTIEEAIYAQNVQTALKMGHARGIVLLAGANNNLEIFEYTPKKIKLSVVGNGAATKEQVRFMVSRILGISEKSIPLDASDALAVAICYLNQNKFINC